MQIPLSSKDKKDLYKLHRSTKDKKSADRIKMIILLDKGYRQKEISSILMLDEDTILNWHKKFILSVNLKDYLEDNYICYNGKLRSEEIEEIKNYIRANIIINCCQLISFIEEKFKKRYTQSGIQKLLKKMGFSYKQLSLFPSKADIEKQKNFIDQYDLINNNLSKEEEIVFIDSVHPQHNTRSSKAWIEIGTEKYIKTNTGRCRLNLNGAYNPSTQDVIIREDETINAQSTIKLFEQIEEYYPTKRIIYAILDNARYYKNQIVKEYLKRSKIEILFLPPYSPNLNLIERLWKFMRKKVINIKYYERFDQFKEAIRNFFNNLSNYKNELKHFIGNKFQLFKFLENPKTNFC